MTDLNGVGPALAAKLVPLGVRNVQDLLFHLPTRYEDRTRLYPVGRLVPGMRALVVGRIERADLRFGRRRSLLVSVTDGEARLLLRFFHFSRNQMKGLQPGKWLRAFGDVRAGPQSLEMIHPEYRVSESESSASVTEANLTPVYPMVSGITQPRLRSLVEQALGLLDDGAVLDDLLPSSSLPDPGWPSLAQALRCLHRPTADEDLTAILQQTHPAHRRLAFEELVAHHASLRRLRSDYRCQPAPRMQVPDCRAQLTAALPFVPTAAQCRVIDEIVEDLARAEPMLRLVQGDVGSGKTVVAAAAMLAAVRAGYQAALMAPTELLAEQHSTSISAWLEPLGISVACLTGRLPRAVYRERVEAIAAGQTGVAIGTQALFQTAVEFDRLGLVIIDEQHRFGVDQRRALIDKAGADVGRPHQLVLTATPIPRTLAMSVYADLDTSVIDELPPGRKPVTTVALSDTRRVEVIERVSAACRDGRQAYWVCTLIEDSDALEAQAAEETVASLRESLPDLNIGLIHGRLKPAEKEAVMQSFKDAEINLLVATTVIEVGVDVPTASLMVIENAERLGLSQLHQLRGRVGRGADESHCVLMYRAPLGELSRQRLDVMRQTHDGFEIARRDLELRGPGELLGTRQTGLASLRVADVVRDADLVDRVQAVADDLLRDSPDRAAALERRWLGDAADYGRV